MLDAPAPEVSDPIATTTFATPLGEMTAAAISSGLCLLEFAGRRTVTNELADLERLLERPVVAEDGHPGRPHLDLVQRELEGYFAGELRRFTVPLVTPGTEFERRVWERLLTIPYGRTCSYGELAAELGSPGGARAVGRANGRNRIAIVVPCHRVIEASGALRGYGGGLHRKRFLLDLESRTAGGAATLFD
jgi:AraC family transcriptional regulator of adaptative response/methylated-DNA-[protein]-cysteine methyltransferase